MSTGSSNVRLDRTQCRCCHVHLWTSNSTSTYAYNTSHKLSPALIAFLIFIRKRCKSCRVTEDGYCNHLHPLIRSFARPSFRSFALLSVPPSVRSSVRPSVRSSVRLSVRQSSRTSVDPSVRPFVRSSFHPRVYLFVLPSVRQSVRPSLSPPSIHPSVHQ